jgi:hypothetical protein
MAWVFSKPIYLSARGATLPADQITSRPMGLVQSVKLNASLFDRLCRRKGVHYVRVADSLGQS